MATPTTTFYGPGPNNVYIPTFGEVSGATGKLQVEFSRNPARFRVNDYVQWVPDAAEIGMYLELDTFEAVRVVNLQDFVWPDGNDAPDVGNRPLRWKKYQTERRAYPFTLGQKTVDNAAWDIVASHARMSATQAMTARSYDAVTTMTTAATWPTGSKAATVDLLLGGSGLSWTASSTTELTIQKSIQLMQRSIVQNTGGAVTASDMILVIGPATAHAISTTAEVRAYMVNHEQAISALEGRDRNINAAYGLPRYLYGVEIVVEDAVRNTTRKGATTQTMEFMMGNQAVMVSRPGGLMGVEGVNFSTIVGFLKEDMTTETMTDPWNRRTKGRVVEDIDIVIAAPISGYHIADITT